MIYLSPHYDDAVLSCGALIRQQARTSAVKIFTVFGLPIGERSEEDSKAVRYLRATPVSGQRYESMYRDGHNPETVLNRSLNEILPHGDELDPYRIPPDMAFADLLGHEIYCPLAVGGHIDHIIVRRLVSLLSLDVWYWEDLPYCFTRDIAPWTKGMVSRVVPIRTNSPEFKLWMEAIAKYKSQIPGLFGTPEIMRDQFTNYIQRVGGIRLWRKA